MEGTSAMRQRGYTLVEIAIAMSLLASMMAVATTILIYTLRLNTQTKALRTTQQNTRQALEAMFRQIRLGSGFYDNGSYVAEQCRLPRGYDPAINPENELFIKSSRGEILRYHRDANNRLVETNYGRCPTVPAGPAGIGGPLISKLTGDDIEVCDLTFIRDDKFEDTSGLPYVNFAPSFLTIRIHVKTPSCASPPGFGVAEMQVEESVSLRGEFNNFFQ